MCRASADAANVETLLYDDVTWAREKETWLTARRQEWAEAQRHRLRAASQQIPPTPSGDLAEAAKKEWLNERQRERKLSARAMQRYDPKSSAPLVSSSWLSTSERERYLLHQRERRQQAERERRRRMQEAARRPLAEAEAEAEAETEITGGGAVDEEGRLPAYGNSGYAGGWHSLAHDNATAEGDGGGDALDQDTHDEAEAGYLPSGCGYLPSGCLPSPMLHHAIHPLGAGSGHS
eukprot:jgi/Chrpa1/16608/Chrysochromulina_OHIO_Genome00018860-RA